MKLSERMLREYERHDARYDSGLDVPAPPLHDWASEVAALEAEIERLREEPPWLADVMEKLEWLGAIGLKEITHRGR